MVTKIEFLRGDGPIIQPDEPLIPAIYLSEGSSIELDLMGSEGLTTPTVSKIVNFKDKATIIYEVLPSETEEEDNTSVERELRKLTMVGEQMVFPYEFSVTHEGWPSEGWIRITNNPKKSKSIPQSKEKLA